MNNNEKLSLFRKGNLKTYGLSDIASKKEMPSTKKLSLNKEIISNFINVPNYAMQDMPSVLFTPCIGCISPVVINACAPVSTPVEICPQNPCKKTDLNLTCGKKAM